MLAEATASREAIERELEEVHDKYPHIMRAVRTLDASLSVLRQKSLTITRMTNCGLLDEIDAFKLQARFTCSPVKIFSKLI